MSGHKEFLERIGEIYKNKYREFLDSIDEYNRGFLELCKRVKPLEKNKRCILCQREMSMRESQEGNTCQMCWPRREVMTTQHKDWHEFVLRLMDACNFRVCGEEVRFVCGGFDGVKRVLKEHYPNVDVRRTLDSFEALGGICDCSVIFNVAMWMPVEGRN